MNNQLTVLIPTSPIPSHPSTAILDETIANVRKYSDCKIVIMGDGIHPSLTKRTEAYGQYLFMVGVNCRAGKYGDCELKNFYRHTHQVEMTRRTLMTVTTPLIMFVEHDTSPIGDIPFKEVCDVVELFRPVNYIRFNIFEKIPEEHRYLMLEEESWWKNNDCGEWRFDSYNKDGSDQIGLIYLTPTIQFSARPHIAKSDWYRKILLDYFPEGYKGMIEDVMHGVVIEKYKELKKDIFGLFIYTPKGNQLRSYHSDGRQDDEKIIYG